MSLRVLSTSAVAFASISVVSSFRTKKDESRHGKGVKIYLAGQDEIATWDKKGTFVEEYWRPDYLKHQRCSGDEYIGYDCQECEPGVGGDYDCFSSDKYNSKELKLKVRDGTWTRFISTFELKCPKAGALVEYAVDIDTHYDDDWKVFVNGVPEVAEKKGFNKYGLNLGNVGHGQTMEVRLEFTASEKFKDKLGEAGKMEIIGTGAIGEYLQCEDYEVCLSKLAGSFQGRQLRTKNHHQHQCLTNTLASSGYAGLQPVCDQWRTCLRNSVANGGTMEDGILKLLEAGLQHGRGTSLQNDPDGCIDPRFSDPEGWACNCLADWKKKCVDAGYGADDDIDADCLTASFCSVDMVCPSWKEGACHKSNVQAIMADPKFSSASLVQQGEQSASADALTERASNKVHTKTKDAYASLETSTGAKSCI